MADVDEDFHGKEVEDQIDVDEESDEEAGTFLFDHETFIRKLKEKPQLPSPPDDCGTQCPKKSYKDWSAPLGDRLSLPALSSIDVLKETIPFPRGCVPPLALPSWHFLPLEKRIPYLTAGKDLIFYTRGKLGQKLHRKPVIYSLRDQLNFERVVGGPYNALHDPHAKSFLYTPLFHDFISRNGFINSQDDVLCTLREFNKFRDYLRTLWCDEVQKEVDSADVFFKSQREQFRALMKAESATAIQGAAAKVSARIANARKLQAELARFKNEQQWQRDELSEARLKEWQEHKERQIIEHIMEGMEKARRNKERLEALYEQRLQRRRDIMTKTIRKYYETQQRRLNDKAMMQAAYNKFLLEWLESKYVFCYENVIAKKKLQTQLKECRKYRAKRRERRLEAYRKAMPGIQEKRKAEERRIWEIVRKFAMRWLGKVRRRLNAPKDYHHESCWIGQSKGVLDDTLEYLHKESGHEKLDDFFMNIIKLKKQIQAQIEAEEAEEAAAAAAAAAEGEDEEEEG